MQVGSTFQTINIEQRKIAWRKINQGLAKESYEIERITSLVQVFWRRHQTKIEAEKTRWYMMEPTHAKGHLKMISKTFVLSYPEAPHLSTASKGNQCQYKPYNSNARKVTQEQEIQTDSLSTEVDIPPPFQITQPTVTSGKVLPSNGFQWLLQQCQRRNPCWWGTKSKTSFRRGHSGKGIPMPGSIYKLVVSCGQKRWVILTCGKPKTMNNFVQNSHFKMEGSGMIKELKTGCVP